MKTLEKKKVGQLPILIRYRAQDYQTRYLDDPRILYLEEFREQHPDDGFMAVIPREKSAKLEASLRSKKVLSYSLVALTTIALCSLSGAVMFAVGIQGRPAAAGLGNAASQDAMALKPELESADDSIAFADFGTPEGNARLTDVDWELFRTASRVLERRKLAAEYFPPDEDVDELLAATAQLAAFSETLKQKILKHEASIKESKDAISENMGTSR